MRGRKGSGRRSISLPLALLAFGACGFLLSLSFPKENLYALAWVALAPAFIVTDHLSTLRAALGGLFFGLGLFSKLLFWLNLFGFAAYVLVVLMQSLFYAVAFGVGRLVGRRLGSPILRGLTFAASYAAFAEWLRAQGPFGFTWGMLAQSQYLATYMLQGCALFGSFGLSLGLAVSNGFLAAALKGLRSPKESRPALLGWAFSLVFLAVVGDFGDLPPEPKVKVAVIQGRTEQRLESKRFIYGAPLVADYEEMSLVWGRGAKLIVWPETALPGPISGPRARQDLIAVVRRIALRMGSWLLVGAPEVDSKERIFNSVHLLSPEGKIVATYRKVHLVPFGEYVPGGGRLRRWLKRFGVREFDFSPGPGFEPLRGKEFSVGVAICFESVFPYIARRLVKEGVDFLAVLTNDSWFGRTAAPEQHLSFSVLRAVETGRYVLRGAMTGISAIIHPRGFIIREAGLYEPKALRASIRRAEHLTPYVKLGDWPIFLAFLWLVSLSLFLTFSSRSTRGGRECSRSNI